MCTTNPKQAKIVGKFKDFILTIAFTEKDMKRFFKRIMDIFTVSTYIT